MHYPGWSIARQRGATFWRKERSGGRFHLGLGPLIRTNIIEKYSMPWSAPAPRMREYVHALRALFDCWQNGTRLDYRGEHYRFTRMQAFVAPPPIEHPEIPIHMAGIGPNMTAVAGELADALITPPTNVSPRFLRERTRPWLAKGAARTGRDASRVRLFVNPLVATGADETTVRTERERQRALLAVLHSTPSYWPSLAPRYRRVCHLPHEGPSRAWATTREAEILAGARGLPSKHTVADAIDKFILEVCPHRKGERWERIRLTKFRRHKLALRPISKVSSADMALWRDERLGQVSPSSVAREMNLWGALFTIAVREWRWLQSNPLKGVNRPTEPPARRRGITNEEIAAIVKKLGDDGASGQVQNGILV